MKKIVRSSKRNGFSLAEMLAALIIGSMIIVCLVAIYSRVDNSSAAIINRIEKTRMPNEILQLIAEDLDGIIGGDKNTKITITGNKIERGYITSRLEILKTYLAQGNESKTFERIVWQASYDMESDVNGLVLYRGHSGIIPEDSILDKERTDEEKKYNFMPVHNGVKYFRIQAIGADVNNPVDEWAGDNLPTGVIMEISFAEPFKTITGQIDVLDEEKTIRTVCIDRSRKPQFNIVASDINQPADSNNKKAADANKPGTTQGKNDANTTGKKITNEPNPRRTR